MVLYRLVIFDRHCECIYSRQWHKAVYKSSTLSSAGHTTATKSPTSPVRLSDHDKISTSISSSVFAERFVRGAGSERSVTPSIGERGGGNEMSLIAMEDNTVDIEESKLVFGLVYSLRSMVRKMASQ